MNFRDILQQLSSGDNPGHLMGGSGLIVLLLGLKLAKGFFKFLISVAALALLGAAVWWYTQHR